MPANLEFNNELISNLTFIVPAGEDYYLKINSAISTCIMGIKIVESGGTLVAQSTIDSYDYFHTQNNKNALLWENIVISGSTIISNDVYSEVFLAPNIMYFNNTSVSGQNIRVSLRGTKY